MTEQHEKRLAEIRKWKFYGCNGNDLKFLFERLDEANASIAELEIQRAMWKLRAQDFLSERDHLERANESLRNRVDKAKQERDSLKSQLDVAVVALKLIVTDWNANPKITNDAECALIEIEKIRSGR